MKKLSLIILILSLCLGASVNTFAQGCEEPEATETDDGNKPRIIGFVQPQYEYHFEDDHESTFKFKRARVGITGKIPYDFAYYAVMEFSPFVSQTGNPYLLDVFISYRRFKWANISVGSFKQPFGLEVNTSCSGLHTIERAMASDQIVAPQRDMGLMILGGTKADLFQYKFAIMNGTGLGKKDNNNRKDIIGRAVINPTSFLSIGGSFRHGWPTKDSVTRTSFAGDIELNFSNFLVQAEYIYDEGDYDRSAGGGCGSDPLILGEKRSGWYAMAMYKFYFNLQPVIKVEQFDTGDAEEYQEFITTFGLNYWFNDNTRLQANYRYRAESNITNNAETPNDAILLQLQVKF